MYLFQQVSRIKIRLYNEIYIPLCIYFNHPAGLISSQMNTFTFHYVSISTIVLLIKHSMHNDLHSTMYLFQQEDVIDNRDSYTIYIPLCIYFNCRTRYSQRHSWWFTFHYVSISTFIAFSIKNFWYIFTFHYVSISTL